MVSILCFGCVALLGLPAMACGLVYLLGVFAFDAINPLLNAISVAYNGNGFYINYGVGRGIGSFAYAVAALVIGKVMAVFGADWMLLMSAPCSGRVPPWRCPAASYSS